MRINILTDDSLISSLANVCDAVIWLAVFVSALIDSSPIVLPWRRIE